MKTQPTHITVKIEYIDFEINRLKDRLSVQLSYPIKKHLQGQLEAYLAVKMQNKVCIAEQKTL